MSISVIIPVLNEECVLREKVAQFQALREAGHEIIVVDGDSEDSSMIFAREFADHVLSTDRGRAKQMNAGVQVANNDLLLFLHIDTEISMSALEALARLTGSNKNIWGRFDVRISGSHFMFRVIETMMNWRSRITGIATGDQAIFVSKALFDRVNGFTEIPLMEDIEISTRLKKISKPVCMSDMVTTSSRRWEKDGIYRTIWLMWRLRLAFWFGKDPAVLVQRYYQ